MIDIEDLRRKAEAATPGPWSVRWGRDGKYAGQIEPMITVWNGIAKKASPVGCNNAAFIAAANPATILALIAEIDRCHARLEIDHVYRLVDGETVRENVAYADRGNVPDGIECRDATIGQFKGWISELKAKVKSPR